jgi:hypothetical protein
MVLFTFRNQFMKNKKLFRLFFHNISFIPTFNFKTYQKG